MFKKVFTIAVVFATVCWSMGLAAVMPAFAATISAGDLIKASGAAVYYYGADGMRYVFTSEDVYMSWYSDFSGVKTITDAELAAIDMGGNITVRPGSKLVKITTDPKTYAVEMGGVLRHIESEAAALALYGADWASMIVDVDDNLWFNYKRTGASLDGTANSNGSLVKYAGSDTIYLIEGGKKRAVSTDAFAANMFKSMNVLTISDTITYSDGAALTGEESDITNVAGGVNNDGPVTTTGGLMVALAADTPASGIVVSSSARTPFTKINLTASEGDVTVSSLVVQRTGLGNDNAFTTIDLIDAATGIALNKTSKSLNSDHQATFTDDFVVESGTTRSVIVAGNMGTLTSYAGEVPSLTLVDVVTLGSSVSGSLPIAGNYQTLNATISIGSLTVAEGSDPGTASKEVGTTGYNFVNVKLTAATEDMQVESLKLYNVGSADASDLANAILKVDGIMIGESEMDGNYITFDLTDCGTKCMIEKGNNKEFGLYGDIAAGSGRTFDFDVKKATDIVAKGLTYGYYVTPSAALDAGNTVTVSRGKINISKTNTVPAGNVPEDASNVELGSWNFKVTGEPITVDSIDFATTITGSGGDSTDITSAVLYLNGSALTGSVDGSSNNIDFSDTFTLPIGDNEITMKATLSSDWTANQTITLAVDYSSVANLEATGDVTGETINTGTYITPVSTISANQKTTKSAAMTVTTATSPAATSVVYGSVGQTVANIILDAGASSEGVQIRQIKVTDTPAGGAKTIDMQNITLYVNDVALEGDIENGSTATANTAEVFTFDLEGDERFTVGSGNQTVVEIRVDVAAGATAGTHTFAVATADYVTGYGVDSNNQVTESIDTAKTGQALTLVANGTLATSLDSSNPDAQLLVAGTTGVTLAVFKMEAEYEDAELDTMLLTQVSTASSSASDYDKVYLEDEAGTVVATLTYPTSTTPFLNFIDGAYVVDKDDSNGEMMYVKADLASIGTGYNGVSGHKVGYKVALAADVVAKGAQTGTGITESGTATGNDSYVYKSVPSVSLDNSGLSTKLGNGSDVSLFKFKVGADTNDLDLHKFSFSIATTSCNITAISLYDVTGTEVDLSETDLVCTAAACTVDAVIDKAGSAAGSNIVTVTGGSTRTFELRGTVSGADAAGDLATIKLMGDAAEPASIGAVGTATLIDADTNDDFIWSDMSASSHAIGTGDWMNGYLVDGLNSTFSTSHQLAY
jgi:hypothetical protein